ncbi:hypothetical protein RMCBS344292_19366 [Rhizopus microsporus]|nr:hypothetical protein RMCBS344292_19366 [Rhizopus microsporus]
MINLNNCLQENKSNKSLRKCQGSSILTDQVKVPQTFRTKSWKNWRTARPSIYRRTSKNLLRTFQSTKVVNGPTVRSSTKSSTENLKGKLWMPSKAQTQYTRELIDSSLQEEQQQTFTKNANNFLNQEEVKSNSFTLWKASNNSRFTHTPRVRSPKVKLGQWRSRRSGLPTASNTWKKILVTRPWPWPWAGKRLKEFFKPDTNNPSSKMQLDDNNNHLTTITEDLDVNRDTPGAVEPSTGLFLDAARVKYTRRPKAPINPNNIAINTNVFPHGNGALRHTKRWHITKGSFPTFLRAMETDNTSFMTCVSSNTRISTSVESQTSTMETYSDEVHGRRASGSGRSSEEISEFRHNRAFPVSVQELPIKILYCERTKQTQADIGLHELE